MPCTPSIQNETEDVRPNKTIRLFFLFSIFAFFNALPDPFCLGFQRPNGAPGDPGQNGGVGNSGADIDWHATATGIHSNHRFYAGHGQHGGHGGVGIDGNDPDSVAQGGNGGRGGNGGNINARMSVVPQSLWQYYYGGQGGAGGTGGTSVGLPNGQGAGGGNGGSVQLNLSAEEGFDAFGYGGSGGTGYGFGNQGGNGGHVTAETHLVQGGYADADLQRLVTTLVAGNGANGIARARGGNGGQAILAAGSTIEASANQYRFKFDLTGGNGGKSFGADGGIGGDALITAPRIVSTLPYPVGLFSREASFSATGGQGGDSHLFYGSAASAGNGGDAVLASDSNSRLDVDDIRSFKVELTGGDGGSVGGSGHLLPGLTATAGNGGDGRLDRFSLTSSGANSSGFALRPIVNLTGGRGGNNSFGRGGNGGNAILNALKIESKFGYSQWSLTAGEGGDGQIGGSGGHAILIDALEMSSNTVAAQHYLTVRGGHAGSGSTAGGIGGNAELRQAFHGSKDLQIEGNSVAGLATDGSAGSASADLTGIVTGTANVSVFSGAQPDYPGSSQLARNGSSVFARANSQSDAGNATSRAVATGGRGWEKSGTAEAISMANSQHGNAVSRSEAVSFGSPLEPSSMATSFSNAKSMAAATGITATANSSSLAYGHFTSASSKGSIQGTSGTSTTHAETRTTSRFHWANSDLIVNVLDTDRPVFTESRVAFRQSYQQDLSNHMRVATFLEGDASTLVGLQSGTLNSQYDFADGAYNLLSTSEIITSDAGTSLDFNGSLNVRQKLDSWEHENNYYAFFYDLESIAGGLQNLDLRLWVNGNAVLDETFATGDLAVGYLQDWSMLVADSTDSDVNYELAFSGGSQVGQHFQLRMGIAGLNPTAGPMSFTAVPEPGSTSLGLLGLTLLAVWRRQRT